MVAGDIDKKGPPIVEGVYTLGLDDRVHSILPKIQTAVQATVVQKTRGTNVQHTTFLVNRAPVDQRSVRHAVAVTGKCQEVLVRDEERSAVGRSAADGAAFPVELILKKVKFCTGIDA